MYILYRGATSPTGRALRQRIGCHGGKPRHYSRQRESVSVVRWGVSEGEDAARVLNSGNAVARAANKLESLRIMEEAGISVPRFSTNPADFGDATYLGRKRSHFGGRDVEVFVGQHTRAVFSDYFTEFVPSEREMRLHIFQGRCIGAQNKRWEGDGEAPDVPIRNHDRGWVFVPLVHSTPNADRIEVAAAAVQALALDFGAVDLLVTPGGGTTVLEVNTAPGLSERFLDIYAEAIGAWGRDGG